MKNEFLQDLTVLIVEDDYTSELLLKEIFSSKVKEIISCKDGLEALEISKSNNDIDIILLDIKIPGLNGIEVCKEIRKYNSDILIIAQSAYALVGDSDIAISAGCNDYITKPIDKNVLFEKIRSNLN